MLNLQNNLRYDRCPLCGAINIDKVGNIEFFQPVRYSTTPVSMLHLPELWKCAICNSGFVQNAVPEAKSISLYQQGNSAVHYATRYSGEPKTTVVAEALKQLFQKGKRVLDIGCNTGDLLDFARNRGCQTAGVEYSLDSLAVLKNKGHIAYSNMEEVDSCFDIITAFDLVEHLYNLSKFLEICIDRLSPDGYLVFLTGDINCFWARFTRANWWYVRYIEHITFPSKKYFDSHPKLELVNWISTYADRAYDRPKLQVIMSIAKRLLLGDYSGLPALSPDHALIILKPRKYPR